MLIDPKLENKVAVITGANNPYGIGACIAKTLAAQGVNIFLHYFREIGSKQTAEGKETQAGEAFYQSQQVKSPDETLEAICRMGGKAAAWEGDLSNPDTIHLLLDEAETAFGPVDILVNNAAYWEADTFIPTSADLVNKFVEAWTAAPGQIDSDRFDRIFAVNTRAVVLLMAEFAHRHVQRHSSWGRIINISTDGAYCFPSEISYGASKLATEGYTRSAAKELGQYGITVNTVSPGPVQTGWLTPDMEKEIATTNPMKRVGQPEDIAAAVLFFASEQAAWVTGQTLSVGGGNAV